MGDHQAKKVRTGMKTNRSGRTRQTDWVKQYEEHQFADRDTDTEERVRGKGDLFRYRTVSGDLIAGDTPTGNSANNRTGNSAGNPANNSAKDSAGTSVEIPATGNSIGDQSVATTTSSPDIQVQSSPSVILTGRVLSTHGLNSTVQDVQTHQVYRCQTRRLLKTLQTTQRNIVAAGDLVEFRPERTSGLQDGFEAEGFIERVLPRAGVLCRTSRKRQHIIAANVDQVLIIASAAEPNIKPNLIDRIILTAEKVHVRPVICINKIDLVPPEQFQPLAGVYASAGYDVMFLSATQGQGIHRLRERLRNRASVVTGQSGVGKTSLLNAVDPDLGLRTREVSLENDKGRHTTTAAELIPLAFGGYVLDTPGIRSFDLWDVVPEEVASLFRDIRPFVSQCRYDDCTHQHENQCAVKNAVGDGKIDLRRYEAYCQIFNGELDKIEF